MKRVPPFRAAVVEVDGRVHEDVLSCLEDLQTRVGGDVEVIGFGPDHSAYVNENGIALNLPRNGAATAMCELLHVGLAPDDFIKGPMVIVGQPGDDGNDTDCHPSAIEWVRRQARFWVGKEQMPHCPHDIFLTEWDAAVRKFAADASADDDDDCPLDSQGRPLPTRALVEFLRSLDRADD